MENTRRKILQAAIASGSVVTHKSVSAFSPNRCVTPSGFHSFALNPAVSNAPRAVECHTRTVEFWQQLSVDTAMPLYDRTISDFMGGTSQYGTLTVRQALNLSVPASRMGELGVLQHVLAMVLNTNTTPVANMDQQFFRRVWQDYTINGQYQAVAGIWWDSDKIIQWLRALMYPTP